MRIHGRLFARDFGGIAFLLSLWVTTSWSLLFDQIERREDLLNRIHDITTNNIGTRCHQKRFQLVHFPISIKELSTRPDDFVLMSRFLGHGPYLLKDEALLRSMLKILLLEDDHVDKVHVVLFDSQKAISATRSSEPNNPNKIHFEDKPLNDDLRSMPWFIDRSASYSWLSDNFILDRRLSKHGVNPHSRSRNVSNWWTYPYFSCQKVAWSISFIAPIDPTTLIHNASGLIVFDRLLSGLDLNQCGMETASGDHRWNLMDSKPLHDEDEKAERENAEDHSVPGTSGRVINHFHGTHKCHRDTSTCSFDPGHGWTRGGYFCRCKSGFFGATGSLSFNGSLVEVAWNDKLHEGSDAFDLLYRCQPCAEGCATCLDASPCLAYYNWMFRWVLLVISILCVFLSLIFIPLVFKFRKYKVFKLASPMFLSITLVGCAIMYLEMVAIFPYLNMPTCIATKWTRNMGFLVTYSALLMKTWRVSLTYRVKSAHKLKLTDNQLLQWFFPILLVMVIYLCSWTVSDPPQAVFIKDSHGLKFKQCHFGWWDGILSTGELVFLLWGVRVCVSVRKARTHFGEAKLIRWSIYNIATVNLVMVSIHVLLFPHAGPDMKYFLGFLRTQMSTSTTIILFWRVAKGTANDLDDQLRAKGNSACMFSIPVEDQHDEPKDLSLENEELKEEIQKLASQIQYLRIVGMLTANFHIKNKKEGYFSEENATKLFQQNLETCLQNGSLSMASIHRTLSLNQSLGGPAHRNHRPHPKLRASSSCSVQVHKFQADNRRSLGTFAPPNRGLPGDPSGRVENMDGSSQPIPIRSVSIGDPAAAPRFISSQFERAGNPLEPSVETYLVTSPSGRVMASPLELMAHQDGKGSRPTLVHLKKETCPNLIQEGKNV
ncbi:hypothetical protein TCAL_12818 [Tigriopus californicus]|uniref:G-protein coupled receptors family 3 profile domain-containing protein n=1 Tax=Tigriopus californicus TaxID=6832 RepID=A0A553PS62_TIGCA|nr:hypothetical protein TCAL_12818 [Tigriopus californicus]|eukprot:TCALIF_12818-PA protein Name:"Similar to CG31760 Probable G-protein coupled receptor CG31760 (Drosophila melanogaster)" AED:0.06 eAED:0.06 QI:56/0.94/0.83/1/0.82/0.83/18/112/884